MKLTRFDCEMDYGSCDMEPREEGQWVRYDEIAHLLRAQAKPSTVPNVAIGFAIVPTEPTPQMRKAAVDAWLDCDSRMILNKAAAALKAGIAAAYQSGETK